MICGCPGLLITDGLEPFAYLCHIFKELPLAETVDDIDALLPDAVKSAGL